MENSSAQELIDKIRVTHGERVRIIRHPDSVCSSMYHISISEKDSRAGGMGSARTMKEAVLRAYSEFVERKVFWIKRDAEGWATSNGMACHLTERQAREAATAELLERDAFVSWWLTRYQPAWIDQATLEPLLKTTGCEDVFKDLVSKGFHLNVALIATSNDHFCTIATLTPCAELGGLFGMVIEANASRELAIGLRNIIMTMERDALFVRNRIDTEGIAFKKISANDVATTADHLDYYLDPGNAAAWNWITIGSSSVPKINIDRICVTTIPIEFETAWPLAVCHASSPSAQQYFVGATSSEHLNLLRLGVSSDEDINNLNQAIHPLS